MSSATPPSARAVPAMLWPPQRTDRASPWSRAKSTVAVTSALPVGWTTSAGVFSINPFQRRVASSKPPSPGVRRAPPRRSRSASTACVVSVIVMLATLGARLPPRFRGTTQLRPVGGVGGPTHAVGLAGGHEAKDLQLSRRQPVSICGGRARGQRVDPSEIPPRPSRVNTPRAASSSSAAVSSSPSSRQAKPTSTRIRAASYGTSSSSPSRLACRSRLSASPVSPRRVR
jgi:hypothetical protein